MPKSPCCSAKPNRACSSNSKSSKRRVPSRILDVGSGPGRASGVMKGRWPKSEVIALDIALPMLRQVPKHTRFWRPVKRVCAEAAHLPFADNSIDLIFSNLCLQWVPDLPAALAEFRRVLREDGLLLFSSFGPDTLIELREAYLQAGERHPPLSPFAAIQQVGDAMIAAGFRNPVLDRDLFTLTYPRRDVPAARIARHRRRRCARAAAARPGRQVTPGADDRRLRNAAPGRPPAEHLGSDHRDGLGAGSRERRGGKATPMSPASRPIPREAASDSPLTIRCRDSARAWRRVALRPAPGSSRAPLRRPRCRRA